jgi:hypothetical protein
MMIKDSNGSDILTIPLDLAGCMVHFKHRLHILVLRVLVETGCVVFDNCEALGSIPVRGPFGITAGFPNYAIQILFIATFSVAFIKDI